MPIKNILIYNRVINSSEKLFSKYGFSKCTADEIAKEAGISKRTMYKYFKGKVAILEELINIRLNFIHEQMHLILGAHDDFPEKLKKIMGVVAESLKYVNRNFLEDIRRSVPDVWLKLSDYKKELVKTYYTKILIEGQKAGHFKKNINIGVAVLLMNSVFEHIINPPAQGYLPSEMEKEIPFESTVLFDKMITLIYEGILN